MACNCRDLCEVCEHLAIDDSGYPEHVLTNVCGITGDEIEKQARHCVFFRFFDWDAHYRECDEAQAKEEGYL